LDDFSIFFGDFSIFWWNFFVPQTQVELFGLTIGIFILWKFDDNKNKARMAIEMPMFYTPAFAKNVFTMLRWSPISKIFSTSTLHAIHYESQEAPLRALQ
jgi:hypothetical protein